MAALPLVVAVLVVTAVAAFVAGPLVRRGADPGGAPEAVAARQAVERRDRALAALRELEFDHRTGKLGDGDYAELRDALRGEAAAALRGVEAW